MLNNLRMKIEYICLNGIFAAGYFDLNDSSRFKILSLSFSFRLSFTDSAGIVNQTGQIYM